MENFTTSEEMKEFIRQMDKKIDNLDIKLVLKAQQHTVTELKTYLLSKIEDNLKLCSMKR